MPIKSIIHKNLDFHAHVFTTDLCVVDGARYSPDYEATINQYIDLLKINDLQGGVLVQPSFLGYDNSYMLDSIKSSTVSTKLNIFAVVVIDVDCSQEEMIAMKDAGAIGFRLNLIGDSTFTNFVNKDYTRVIQIAKELGWFVELQVEARRLSEVLPQFIEHRIDIVIDHFGLVETNAAGDLSSLRPLFSAPLDQLFIKASAPYRLFPQENIQSAISKSIPIFQQLADHVSLSHMLWGSDWPNTQFEHIGSYEEIYKSKEVWVNSLQ